MTTCRSFNRDRIEFRSFNNNASKRVLNLLPEGYLRLREVVGLIKGITVIKIERNNRDDLYCGIEMRYGEVTIVDCMILRMVRSGVRVCKVSSQMKPRLQTEWVVLK